MPDLLDRIYCSEQIHIPPTFPYIMKLYCKAAIRTQPYDLLKWSAAYFRALANGEEPPAKERVEYPPYDSPSGLTPGYIKILINQFGKDPSTMVTAQTLFKKWTDICLDEYLLIKLIALLGANTTVNWVRFVGVCAGYISKTLTHTMILICELFTEEPEGGMATIPFDLFADLYMFLAQMECGPITEKERAELDAIMEEEDICDVAGKIMKGIYGEEYTGEDVICPEEITVEGIEEELVEESAEEEVLSSKESGETTESSADEEAKEGVAEVAAAGLQEEKPEEQPQEEKQEINEPPAEQPVDKVASKASDPSFEESQRSVVSTEKEFSAVTLDGESFRRDTKASFEEKQDELEVTKPSAPAEEVQPKPITLDDLEESIRMKIEEKLAEEETVVDEEEKEFEELDSYLLGAAKRAYKFTAEALGFKIFRKHLRQEVPGIGPHIESEQVEKVIDFMDSWSHKQQLLVMPRNIRHWMCPPLDKVPTPEP